MYDALRAERHRLQALHDAYDALPHHHCDGTTVVTAFHPKGLPLAKSLPDLAQIFGGVSNTKPPKQDKLARVINIANWHACFDANRAYDRAHPAVGHPSRRAAMFISTSQRGPSNAASASTSRAPRPPSPHAPRGASPMTPLVTSSPAR
jgi:hypothetical protein